MGVAWRSKSEDWWVRVGKKEFFSIWHFDTVDLYRTNERT